MSVMATQATPASHLLRRLYLAWVFHVSWTFLTTEWLRCEIPSLVDAHKVQREDADARIEQVRVTDDNIFNRLNENKPDPDEKQNLLLPSETTMKGGGSYLTDISNTVPGDI